MDASTNMDLLALGEHPIGEDCHFWTSVLVLSKTVRLGR